MGEREHIAEPDIESIQEDTMNKIWKVTYGMNFDIVRIEAPSIEEALRKAKLYAIQEFANLEDDYDVTEIELILDGWVR